MQVVCVECAEEMVNADQRLVLQAQHPGIPEDQLTYFWQFFVVADGYIKYAGTDRDHLKISIFVI